MTTCSTHVLDAVLGVPAQGIRVRLGDAEAMTDADGRARFDVELDAGEHTVRFETGEWFATAGRDTFYPVVEVAFAIAEQQHVHVPLLLSPYSYTTYRGS
jgi:5-hydroxyisourate hydrolase